MAEREKLEQLVSPRGIARYPRLNRPDEYKEPNTGKVQKNFKVELIVDPAEPPVAEFIKTVEDAAQKKFDETIEKLKAKGGKYAAKAKELKLHVPIEPEYDDEGEETGRLLVKSKKKAEYVRDGELVTATLPLFDSAKNKLENCPTIWGGSVLRLAVALFPYHNDSRGDAGVSLWLNGVQVIDLVTGGGATAEGLGFGDEEGYVASASEEFDAQGAGDDAGDETDF